MHPPCLKLLFPLRIGFGSSNYKSMLNLNSSIGTIKDGVFLLYVHLVKLPFKDYVF